MSPSLSDGRLWNHTLYTHVYTMYIPFPLANNTTAFVEKLVTPYVGFYTAIPRYTVVVISKMSAITIIIMTVHAPGCCCCCCCHCVVVVVCSPLQTWCTWPAPASRGQFRRTSSLLLKHSSGSRTYQVLRAPCINLLLTHHLPSPHSILLCMCLELKWRIYDTHFALNTCYKLKFVPFCSSRHALSDGILVCRNRCVQFFAEIPGLYM